ncbi:MAG: trypsin-like serine protease [Granulosicoccus sp.]
MKLCDLHKRAIEYVIVLMALVSGSIVQANDPDTDPYPDAAFAERVMQFAATSDSAPLRCAGMLLTPKRFMTAAHCIEESLKSIRINCLHGADKPQIVERQIVQIHTPVNHDISIVTLDEGTSCFTSNTAMALSNQSATSLFTLNLSTNSRNQLNILQTNPETYIVDDEACLTQGDSGTPVFTTDIQGDLELAAMLISGTDECPAIQVLANVSDFYDWIEAVLVLPISRDR